MRDENDDDDGDVGYIHILFWGSDLIKRDRAN